MSDFGRKDFSQSAKEAITPDSQKSTLEKAKESVTDTADRLAGKADNSNKSGLQGAFDSAREGKDHAAQTNAAGERSILDKAKDAVGMGNKGN